MTPPTPRSNGRPPVGSFKRSNEWATARDVVAVTTVPLTLSTTIGRLVSGFTKARIIGR